MNRVSLSLIIPVSLIFSMGLLMVFNTTAAEIIDRSLEISTHAALLKQLAYAFVGLGAGMFVYSYGHRALLRQSTPFLIVTTLLLILVFIPGIGQTINGARRWIGLGGYTFQPSECAKIFIPFYFIHRSLMQGEFLSLRFFLKTLGTLLIPLTLILMEPDNGTSAIIIVSLTVLFLLIKIRWIYWALPLFCLVSLGSLVASRMPHVPDRIRVYLHPELDLQGKGHQPHQAKIAAGSGQLWGRGLGESLQKLNYLPEARSDYIAAIFAEECGFFGIVLLIGLYMSFAFAGFITAIRAQDRAGFYVASFLTFLITFQAFLNLGIVSGLLPSKGMTLPFFSQGGSSLIVNMVALCLLLDVARDSKAKIALPKKRIRMP